MDDTISRQAALKGLEDLNITSFYEENEHSKEAYKEVKQMLSELPPVDAVEVVRCKGCKFFSHGYCRFHDAKFVRPDGYCYWGEQKEGEQHGAK